MNVSLHLLARAVTSAFKPPTPTSRECPTTGPRRPDVLWTNVELTLARGGFDFALRRDKGGVISLGVAKAQSTLTYSSSVVAIE